MKNPFWVIYMLCLFAFSANAQNKTSIINGKYTDANILGTEGDCVYLKRNNKVFEFNHKNSAVKPIFRAGTKDVFLWDKELVTVKETKKGIELIANSFDGVVNKRTLIVPPTKFYLFKFIGHSDDKDYAVFNIQVFFSKNGIHSRYNTLTDTAISENKIIVLDKKLNIVNEHVVAERILGEMNTIVDNDGRLYSLYFSYNGIGLISKGKEDSLGGVKTLTMDFPLDTLKPSFIDLQLSVNDKGDFLIGGYTLKKDKLHGAFLITYDGFSYKQKPVQFLEFDFSSKAKTGNQVDTPIIAPKHIFFDEKYNLNISLEKKHRDKKFLTTINEIHFYVLKNDGAESIKKRINASIKHKRYAADAGHLLFSANDHYYIIYNDHIANDPEGKKLNTRTITNQGAIRCIEIDQSGKITNKKYPLEIQFDGKIPVAYENKSKGRLSYAYAYTHHYYGKPSSSLQNKYKTAAMNFRYKGKPIFNGKAYLKGKSYLVLVRFNF